MLNIFKLNKKRDQKLLSKETSFRTILRKIHNKIENTSEKVWHKQFTLYQKY